MVLARTFLALVAIAASSVQARPRDSKVARRFDAYAVHEERSALPPSWAASEADAPLAKRAEFKESFILPLRINLVQNNLDGAHDILMDISDPESPRYSEHLSPEDVAALFAPSTESVDEVLDWLLDAGIDVSRSGNYDEFKGAIQVKLPISDIEELLQTKYEVYEHGPTGTPHIGCKSYSVPQSIKHHIDFITPTMHFDVHTTPSKSNSFEKRDGPKTGYLGGGSAVQPKLGAGIDNLADHDAAGTSTCDSAITPACLRALYGINYTPKKSYPNAFGIVEYTPQSYVPTDMDMFYASYATNIKKGTRPTMESIDGGVLVSTQDFNTNGESNLDLQYGMALTYPQTVQLYQTGDTIAGGSFNTFLDALDSSYCSGDDPNEDPKYPDSSPGGYKGNSCGVYKNAVPKVISTSYGYNEADLTPAYEKRQCAEYMKLGLMGTTFVFSSGDYGVAGNGGNCLNGGTTFNPAFPSTCPYITSIGATEVYPGRKVTDPEGASNEVIFSGGGFSNVFPIPTYQTTAVGSYFKLHKPSKYTSKQYNNSGKARGYPDMAANGVNYVIAIDGSFSLIYGTSASAPTVASIFTLINDARAAAGKKPIGFVNPTLYANPGMFNDITYGGNKGCGTPGFTAVKGWDPVTGLGTPKFQSMMKVFMGLP